MTGDSNFTKIHIEAALEQCSVFVVLNTTFQQSEPNVTYTIEAFCQNNCSGHGVCNGGRFRFVCMFNCGFLSCSQFLWIHKNYFGINFVYPLDNLYFKT